MFPNFWVRVSSKEEKLFRDKFAFLKRWKIFAYFSQNVLFAGNPSLTQILG